EIKRIITRLPVGAGMPQGLVEKLALLPCYEDPAVRRRVEGKVMDDYFTAHPEEKGLDPRKGDRSPGAYPGQPGDIERARADEARRSRLLEDLDWMTQNPIGSGAFGLA